MRERIETTLAAFPDEPMDRNAPPRSRSSVDPVYAPENRLPSPRLGDPVH